MEAQPYLGNKRGSGQEKNCSLPHTTNQLNLGGTYDVKYGASLISIVNFLGMVNLRLLPSELEVGFQPRLNRFSLLTTEELESLHKPRDNCPR